MTKSDLEQKEHSKAPLCRYFRHFRLKNIRTFRSGAHLDFCFPNGRLAQWTVVLGENGTGKTTLLQYLASLQPEQEPTLPEQGKTNGKTKLGPPPFRPAGGGQGWFNWHIGNVPRPWQKPTNMEVSLEVSRPSHTLANAHTNPKESRLPINKDALDHAFEYKYDLTFGTAEQKISIVANMVMPRALSFYDQYFVLGYGANRHIAGPSSPYLTSEAFARRAGNSQTNTLFNDDQPLLSPEQWILGLDHASKSGGKNEPIAKRSLSQAKKCLINILPDIFEITVEPFSLFSGSSVMTVMFKTPYGSVPFGALSLGYKTMAAWLIDFVHRMHIRYSHLDLPETGPAVVLIDEFDLHMHPRWQARVMDFLGKQFPNTQFIVTTHSPLIVQAAGARANLALLKRVESSVTKSEEIVIDNNPIHVRGWRLDQIMTSDLYGMKATRSLTYQKLFKKRLNLLKKEKLSKDEALELSRLTSRLENEAPPGPSKSSSWAKRRLQAMHSSKPSHVND